MLVGMMDILLVGAGITGAMTASILRRKLPDQYRLVVWEKARGAGGRMNTSRSTANPRCSVDLGAQYISSQPAQFTRNREVYDELLSIGLLSPLTEVIVGDKTHPEGTQHFVAPNGINSIVKYYLNKASAEVKYDHQVTNIQERENVWSVSSEQTEKMFDSVILTMPVPQVLLLPGAVQDALDLNTATKKKLQAVEYSARFALGLFYAPGTQIDLPWAARYIRGDPVVVFVAVDSKKRGQDNAEVGPSVLVHASVPFSLQHLEEDKDTVCKVYLLPKLQEIIPGLPDPVQMKCHKWRYSQVYKGYEGGPGAVMLRDKPLLVCGGDAFTGSGFDKCIESANRLAEMIVNKSAI